MSDEKKVSIIVPVYNCEKYVGECLDSLLNQSYDNIEILLINDGSKDDSHNICSEYAKKDSRIVYISKENEGVSKTRNIGLQKATGEYILFVDSDDWIENNAVEILVREIGDYDVIQFGTVEEIKGEFIKKPFIDNANDYPNKDPRVLIYNNVVPELIEKKIGFLGYARPVCSKFYKAEKIRGIYFKSDMKFYEDGDFFLQVCGRNIKEKIVPEYLYYYRDNSQSCMRAYRKNIINEMKIIISRLRETLKELGYEYLIDYVKLDMFCLAINNLLRKEKISYKEIKEICRNESFDLKTLKLDTSGYKIGRKLLYFFAKHKIYIVVYFLCVARKIKS